MLLSIVSFGSAHGQLVSATNDLVFGTVYPGIPKTIDKKTAGAAAEFSVTGTAGDEIAVDFTLPKYMSKNGYNMPLAFMETDCAVDSSGSPDQSSPGADNLDPWQTINYRLGSGGLKVWLGGTLIPNIGQPPGSYSAIITITVAYTGS
ncbi:MAG: DUF4402 domain-containing protein [Candidatus Zixiibacteriota bacterium]|nr:MAG: DUF4402 domain-containing protein [candidate division Zixibacteria bacterium]